MKPHGTREAAWDLPHLEEAFGALRRGKHLCAQSGPVFQSLLRNEEAFGALFTALGFRLVRHPRDFFYFHDSANFTELAERMAVFLFILVEALADGGEPVADALLTRPFACKDLPHLRSERYRAYLREAGVETEEDLINVVRKLEQFGFARRLDADSFAFETPVYRFLDLCMELAEEDRQADAGSADADAPADGEGGA